MQILERLIDIRTADSRFVLDQLGYLPKVGESFVAQGWRFEVVDLDGKRVDKVLAARLPEQPAQE